jgi:hypothetical protein
VLSFLDVSNGLVRPLVADPVALTYLLETELLSDAFMSYRGTE